MNSAVSVKSRLKYRALKENINVEKLFILYVLERILYRLSVSKYADNFTLKGGILLYGLFNERFTRMTTDIDLHAANISNDAEKIRKIFQDIFEIEYDDAINFDLSTLETKNITEFKEYHGVNVCIKAYLDKTRIPVSIDIGYSDIIFPEKQKMTYPVILDDAVPVLYCYSKESIIAEKFEAIVSLGTGNSRYKDFYDIWEMAQYIDFDGNVLEDAIIETFSHRGTEMDHIAAFNPGFADAPYREGRWKGFQKSKQVRSELSLSDAIMVIKRMLQPIVDAIKTEQRFNYVWNSREQEWK